uniref:Sulfide-quinone reductase n=1 Tax=Rhodovulum sulfidophilum TaxID=35806 RepID=A0A0M4LB08_RHOSU|nr:sulfide-quinone reductase [Rhodovulum sulfidophilum]
MAHVVVLGAGLGGSIMAYELQQQLRSEDRITVVTRDPTYHFVPSNPWVAVGWRTRSHISADLAPTMQRLGFAFRTVPATRLVLAENRVELADGTALDYDYLVVATGPELAFDEIEGFGPEGHTQSICHVDHAEAAHAAFERFCENPGPIVVGAAQGASCFGPAYEFAFILDAALRRRRIRDRVPMTFVTSEPYIGHLGLDGVDDTKGLLESALRSRHIKWITSARISRVEAGMMHVEEVSEGGATKPHALPFGYAMMLPAFRGGEGLSRASRGSRTRAASPSSILTSATPPSPTSSPVGVCVAIPPMGVTPVPVGVPKTGFMIESMVTATAHNIGALVRGKEPDEVATWKAVCLADFGDRGIAFIAQPQIPPRNVNWSAEGRWVHFAKIAFEKYFLRKVKLGTAEPLYEWAAMKMLGIDKLKAARKG